jgi:hypothetical protein
MTTTRFVQRAPIISAPSSWECHELGAFLPKAGRSRIHPTRCPWAVSRRKMGFLQNHIRRHQQGRVWLVDADGKLTGDENVRTLATRLHLRRVCTVTGVSPDQGST